MRRTFHLILHTHWDREWYLTRAAFATRLLPAMHDVVSMLDADREARFTLDGQTVLADDAIAIDPSLAASMARAAAGGQLVLGPWYVLADEIIPSGESLVRNLHIGIRDTETPGSPPSFPGAPPSRGKVLYSPDAFGHPAVLPTLARGFGLDAALLWRGVPRDGADRDLYRWRSPDGSAVLLYHFPPQGYEIGAALLPMHPMAAARWTAMRDQLIARSVTSHVAVPIGADHHAPPEDWAAWRCWLADFEPGALVRYSTWSEFVAAASGELSGGRNHRTGSDGGSSDLPLLTGELRAPGHTWILQGIHGTRSRLKRHHARAELALQRVTEPLAALARYHNDITLTPQLEAAWRTLVQSQFHDTLAGTCSDAVAREQRVRLESVEAISRAVATAALHSLTGHDADRAREQGGSPALLLWNPTGRARRGVITTVTTWFRRDVLVGPPAGRVAREGPGAEPFVLRAHDVEIPVQVLECASAMERVDARRHYPDLDRVDQVRIAFPAPAVDGYDRRVLRSAPTSAVRMPQTDLRCAEASMGNRDVEVRFRRGSVMLIDRRTGEASGDVVRCITAADRGDAYTASVDADRARRVHWGRFASIARGPFIAAFAAPIVPAPASGVRGGRIVLSLHVDSPVVRVRLEIEHAARDRRFSLRIPVGAGAECIAGAAFGFVRRPFSGSPDVMADPAIERPPDRDPAQRFVAAGNVHRGLAVLGQGFFEYRWSADRAFDITLIRAIGELSRNQLLERPGHAAWPMPIPGAQEPGRHVIELAVAPLTEFNGETAARCEQLWEDAFLPIQARWIREYTGTDDPHRTGATLGGDGLICSALACPQHGNGMLLRCYNTRDTWVDGCWTVARPVARAERVRLDETPIEPLPIVNAHCVPFACPPLGAVTIRVDRER